MIILVNSPEPRKLVAVLGAGSSGLFLPTTNKSITIYINDTGAQVATDEGLENLLKEDSSRTPIYEGDTITITF